MPQDKPPLAAAEIDLISQWIAQGAERRHAAERRAGGTTWSTRPIYTRPPVITALDFSPDGQLLAVGRVPRGPALEGRRLRAGRPAGRPVRADRVGRASRPTASSWPSPAAARPGWARSRSGTSPSGSSLLSVPVTFDTVYGASWSPDGTKIAFGCADNTVRAIDAKTGEQVLFMGSHNDWALDTVFSADGSHLISVGRDMSAKLTEVATQRFVDNITSITPGRSRGAWRPSPGTRSATRSSSAAPTACPSSTGSSARRSA